MESEGTTDDEGFFERSETTAESGSSLTRRNALRGGFAAAGMLFGAAGTRSLDRYMNENRQTIVDHPSSDEYPVATRRHVSSVGPVFSEDPLFGSGTAWDAYEYIDTELHYLGAHISNSGWSHKFALSSMGVQTKEFDDGSVEFRDSARHSHELSLEVSDAERLSAYDPRGFVPPDQFEEGLSDLHSQANTARSSVLSKRIHRSANLAERLGLFVPEQGDSTDNPNTIGFSWPVEISSPGTRTTAGSTVARSTTDDDGTFISNLIDGSDEPDDSFSLDGTFGMGPGVGSVVDFSVIANAGEGQAPTLTIESSYGFGSRTRKQEWEVDIDFVEPYTATEEYRFGHQGSYHEHFFDSFSIGRSGLTNATIEHSTSARFGDVVAEDDGWIVPPRRRPDPIISHTLGNGNSHSPDRPIRFAVSSPDEQWDMEWAFVGSGLSDGLAIEPDFEKVELAPSQIEPGRIVAGLFVRDERGLSGLGKLEVSIVNAETLGATSVSDTSLTLRGEVEHPELTSEQSGATGYEAVLEYLSPSAGEYEVVETVISTETGGPVSATLTGLEPGSKYRYRVKLNEVRIASGGGIGERATVAKSDPATGVTETSSHDAGV